ncbi:hypothetical protein [Pseudomonas sp. C27(2019)]|uniref:hypothetical protein n=1 Tax=Pseudomonas sp. C27(2019) TaxID=2604941 RepID=UPI0015B55FCF|nr:hypothetical protein [Pseudomonas sp. C27(2019)]
MNTNPHCTRRNYHTIKSFEHYLCMTQRASVVIPLTRLPGVMRALRHPWLRLPQHPHTAVDH